MNAFLTYYFGGGEERIRVLRGIAEALRDAHPEGSVLECSAIWWSRQTALAVREGRSAEWSRKGEALSHLILHDVETLVSMERTQEELVVWLDAIRESGGWVVVGGFEAPGELDFGAALAARLAEGELRSIG